MLTARGEESERIFGLDVGADDYIVKPFSPNELMARVRALLRRAAPAGRERVLRAGRSSSISIATPSPTGGHEVRLTAKEFLLLQYLMEHRGRVLSRDRPALRRLGLPVPRRNAHGGRPREAAAREAAVPGAGARDGPAVRLQADRALTMRAAFARSIFLGAPALVGGRHRAGGALHSWAIGFVAAAVAGAVSASLLWLGDRRSHPGHRSAGAQSMQQLSQQISRSHDRSRTQRGDPVGHGGRRARRSTPAGRLRLINDAARRMLNLDDMRARPPLRGGGASPGIVRPARRPRSGRSGPTRARC